MTKFGDWILELRLRFLNEDAEALSEDAIGDLADLAAQQHLALSAITGGPPCPEYKGSYCSHPSCFCLRAAEEFMKKYS